VMAGAAAEPAGTVKGAVRLSLSILLSGIVVLQP
jgi:hypothetical protein